MVLNPKDAEPNNFDGVYVDEIQKHWSDRAMERRRADWAMAMEAKRTLSRAFWKGFWLGFASAGVFLGAIVYLLATIPG